MTTNVIARLTVTRKNGMKTIVEVHAGPTFHKFFHFYQQQGSRRSTKTLTHCASRNEALSHINAHLQTPGLDRIAQQLESIMVTTNPVISSKICIIKKREYRRLISCSPDKLGLTKVNVLFGQKPVRAIRPIGPVTFDLVENFDHSKLHAGAIR